MVTTTASGYLKTGLSMATYDDLIHGTIYGPVIVPDDSRQGILNNIWWRDVLVRR